MTKKLLIVEYDSEWVELITDYVQNLDCIIHAAVDSNAAGAEIVLNNHIDIVVLDGNLTDGTNHIFFSALENEETAGTDFHYPKHILVFSANRDIVEQARKHGIESFIKTDIDGFEGRLIELATS